MSLLIKLVVSELQFIKGDYVIHPVRPQGRALGVYIEPRGGAGLFKTLDPF